MSDILPSRRRTPADFHCARKHRRREEEHGERWTGRGTRRERKRGENLYGRIIYRGGILRGVQPRGDEEKERRKEGKKERREWLIFGVRGPLLSLSLSLAGRAKECLAFDLYSLLKVEDAQTSSGTSRIVLAPSAKHARTRILSGTV